MFGKGSIQHVWEETKKTKRRSKFNVCEEHFLKNQIGSFSVEFLLLATSKMSMMNQFNNSHMVSSIRPICLCYAVFVHTNFLAS